MAAVARRQPLVSRRPGEFAARLIRSVVQFLKNVSRQNLHLGSAEERIHPDEPAMTARIIEVFRQNVLQRYSTRKVERGANARTYGVVRAEFRVLSGLPDDLAQGILREQEFASLAQLDFADVLSVNPWHSLPDHRPLGGINRSRKALYREQSRLRQQLNGVEHHEPTGAEVFA
ncbi:hypothetical protein [Geodermatophilus sp. CPCC 205761]|uniref:hypothetical protein n=1 Tax=Geodermatophilus sp. CPCC 205761 TaxID=2936597 RepID=UPI003EE92123